MSKWLSAPLVAFALGCQPQQVPGPPAKCVLLLADLSESAHSQEMTKLYAETLHTIVGHISHGDALLVGRITDRSAGQLDLPINESMPPFEPGTDNDLIARGLKAKADEQLAARAQGAETRFAELLAARQRRIMRTDLFGSLELAERVFHSFPQPRKVLVLLSDMVQDAEGTNFATADIGSAAAQELLHRLQGQKRVPDLSGVRVFVVGSGVEDLTRSREIRNFWLAYLHECGADAAEQRYGGALVSFDE